MQLAIQKASKARVTDLKTATDQISPQERLAQIFGDRSICSHSTSFTRNQILTETTEDRKKGPKRISKPKQFAKKPKRFNRDGVRDVVTPVNNPLQKDSASEVVISPNARIEKAERRKNTDSIVEDNHNAILEFTDDQFVTSTPIGKSHLTEAGLEDTIQMPLEICETSYSDHESISLLVSPTKYKLGCESILHGKKRNCSKKGEHSIKRGKNSKLPKNISKNTNDSPSVFLASIARSPLRTATSSNEGKNYKSQHNSPDISLAYKKGRKANHDTKKKQFSESNPGHARTQIQFSQQNYGDQPSQENKKQASLFPSTSTSTSTIANPHFDSRKEAQVSIRITTIKQKGLVEKIDAGLIVDSQSWLQIQSRPPTIGILAYLPQNPSRQQIRALFENIQKNCLPGPDPLDLFVNRRTQIQSRDLSPLTYKPGGVMC